MPRQWKCTVCGYVHDGEEPPESCPRCGSDRSEFIPLEKQRTNLLHDLWDTLVIHVAASHFPNGLVPAAALFWLGGMVTDNPHVGPAAHLLLWLVLAVIPVSLVSGIYDWRKRFAGTQALIFYKKIGLAVTLFALVAATLWLHAAGTAAVGGAVSYRLLQGVLVLGMVGCVTLLGHYGGKLAFKWKDSKL